MNRPLLWLMLVCMVAFVVIVGLIAGAFTDSIQRALTLPRTMGMNAIQGGVAPVKPVVPVTSTTPSRAGATSTPGGIDVTSTPTTGAMGNAGGIGATNILAQDSFQRTDQALWGMASDGRAWQGDANMLAAFSVMGAMGQVANGQGGLNAVLGPASGDSEVLAQEAINHFNGTSVNLGVVLRWTDANNWYKLLIDAGHVSIIKRVNGVSSTLVSLPIQAQDNTAYTLRFRAIGAMLFGKVWPSNTAEPANWTVLTNDTSLTNGQAGIRVLVQSTSVVRIASFLATTASMGM